jgi:Na+/phosphate symporter
MREDALTAALAKLAATNSEARAILGVPAQIEKIATAIRRIMDNSRVRIKEGQLFSDKAILETGKLFTKSKEVLKKAGEAAVTGSKASIETVIADSNTIERMTSDFATAHEDRLASGECVPKSSSTFLCVLYAFEDMAAHVKEATSKMVVK